MAGLLAASGCVDLSAPMFVETPKAAPAPLPTVADQLVGTWAVVPTSPKDQKREFTFSGHRYEGPWAFKATSMFGFAAPWQHLKGPYPTGDGFWGESPDHSGEFVMYVHQSLIVYARMATVKVDGDRATLMFESGGQLALQKMSPDVGNDQEQKPTSPKP